MDNFEGKVAVITGAGSGFGREFARLGTKLGMLLVLADVQQDALDETFAEVSAAGAQAIARRVDVAKGEEIDSLARATLDAFGGVLGAVPVLRTDGDCEGASQSSVRTGQRHATDLSQRVSRVMSEKAVSSGKVSAQEVAGMVFDAIRKEQFYIFSHPHALAAVKTRAEDIVTPRNPTDPFAERPDVRVQIIEALKG